MNKTDLKKLIKPLVKECIHEALIEEGILSGIVSEVHTDEAKQRRDPFEVARASKEIIRGGQCRRL